MSDEQIIALAGRYSIISRDYFKFGDKRIIEFVRAVEQASRRVALEEAIRATSQAKTTSHACDAIRALATGDAN